MNEDERSRKELKDLQRLHRAVRLALGAPEQEQETQEPPPEDLDGLTEEQMLHRRVRQGLEKGRGNDA